MELLIDIGLYVCYGLLIFAVLAAIILPLVSSFSNPRSLIKSGIGVAAIIVLFLIGFIIANGDVSAKYMTLGVGENISRFIGASLITLYLLFIIAVIGIIVTELNKAIK